MKFKAYVVPGLLCLIAASQFATAQITHLTPWKGGGFGMFATTDMPGMRTLSIEGYTDDGEWVVLYAERVLYDLDKQLYPRLQSYPSQKRLREIGEKLIDATFILSSVPAVYKHVPEISRQNEPDVGDEILELYERPFFQLIAPEEVENAPYRVVRLNEINLRL